MPTETLLFIIVAAYALGVLSALVGILARHRRSSSQKDYPPKPHPRARRFKNGWRTDTLTWPDPPTELASGPVARPPTQPSRQVLTGYQPQRTNDEGTDDPGPPPTDGSGVEFAAEPDPFSTPLPPPSLPFVADYPATPPYSPARTTWTLDCDLEPGIYSVSLHEDGSGSFTKVVDDGCPPKWGNEALPEDEVCGMMGHSLHPSHEPPDLNAASPFDEPLLPPNNPSRGMSG